MAQEGLVSRAPSAPVRSVPAGGGLVVMDAVAIMERVKTIHTIMENLMVEGHHYFTFGDTKRKVRMEDGTLVEKTVPQFSLGKPGAELVCLTFGLTPDLDSVVVADDPNAPRTIQISEWIDDPGASKGRRKIVRDQVVTGYYEIKSTCAIWSTSGTLLARASGSCNSCESSFVNQGYSNVKNSILKRSEKRAMVAAVLMASGAGDVFVQDLEDTPTALDGNPPPPAGHATGTGAPSGAAPSGWLSEGQTKLIWAKGKNLTPTAAPAVVEHVIASINAGGKTKMKPYFDAIADGKPAGLEIWAAAKATVEKGAAAPPPAAADATPPAGVPPPADAQGEPPAGF